MSKVKEPEFLKFLKKMLANLKVMRDDCGYPSLYYVHHDLTEDIKEATEWVQEQVGKGRDSEQINAMFVMGKIPKGLDAVRRHYVYTAKVTKSWL